MNWANNLESIQLCCKSRETSSKGYRKLFWNVCARDDGDDVISEGVILCVVVPQRVTIDNPHLSTAPALSR
ncbi:hypothetical protein F8C90_09890 [Ellagibacter isourolithinifaciens]|uniref:Uncharacterized protein n=1 Tax=Ellagibacter isourolithinifaciens TaxID=2137581 RepID=A0A6N6NPX5_9ACTN|nr:hypothetical protein [Ellagibacter isourolithinifaciens]KAB1636332.1 hypothetical protein F8C90_09890 [Ellagibacter isourolithinifaciens]